MEDSEESQEQTQSDPTSVAPQGMREGHLQWAAHSTASTPTPSIMMPIKQAPDNMKGSHSAFCAPKSRSLLSPLFCSQGTPWKAEIQRSLDVKCKWRD